MAVPKPPDRRPPDLNPDQARERIPKPVMLVARPEDDGTWTLILDAPASETLPTELGMGFKSIDEIKTAIVQSLTAPAIAEDRVSSIEEVVPTVNQLVDASNAQDQAIGQLAGRISQLEDQLESVMRAVGAVARPAVPGGGGRIPRLGERQTMPRPYQSITSDIDRGQGFRDYERGAPPVQRERRPPPHPLKPNNEGPRPAFDRGSFVPHRPVGRVAPGPGSPAGRGGGEGEDEGGPL